MIESEDHFFRDLSAGPFAHPLGRSLALLTRSIALRCSLCSHAPLRSLVRSFVRSLALFRSFPHPQAHGTRGCFYEMKASILNRTQYDNQIGPLINAAWGSQLWRHLSLGAVVISGFHLLSLPGSRGFIFGIVISVFIYRLALNDSEHRRHGSHFNTGIKKQRGTISRSVSRWSHFQSSTLDTFTKHSYGHSLESLLTLLVIVLVVGFSFEHERWK